MLSLLLILIFLHPIRFVFEVYLILKSEEPVLKTMIRLEHQ